MPSKKGKQAPVISPVMHGFATYISSALRKPLPKPVLEKTKAAGGFVSEAAILAALSEAGEL